MALLDLFRRKGFLAGSVLVRGLPAHKMYSLSFTFFRVSHATSAQPFGGLPPPESYTDEAPVKEAEDDREMPLGFRFERPVGFYYLNIGVIAYLERDGKMFAQVEHFFPLTRPCEVRRDAESQIELVADWPKIPFEELGSYGVIKPR